MTYLPFTLTFKEPEIIDPRSALSDTRPQGKPPILTFVDPWFNAATWAGQIGVGGAACATVGVPCTAPAIPFALTVLTNEVA